MLLLLPPIGLLTDGLGDGEVVLLFPPPMGLLVVIESNSDSVISKTAVQQTCADCMDAFRDWECVDVFLGVTGFDVVL